MNFRFMFVNRSGAEVELESVEALRDCVSSGTIHEETLLYDGLTRDWAPARVHPIYRLIRDTAAASEPARADGFEPFGDPAGADDRWAALAAETAAPEGDTLDVTLVPPEEGDSASAFWETQERAEKEADMEGVETEDGGFGGFKFGRESVSSPVVSESQSAPVSAMPRVSPRRPSRREAVAKTPTAGPPEQHPAPPPARLQNLDVPDWGLRWVSRAELNRALTTPVPQRQAALMIVLAGIGGWGIADSWTPPISEPDTEVVLLSNSWRISTHFTAGHPEVRSGAFQDMVRGMDVMRARMGVGDPPAVWLSDSYLDSPDFYPEVVEHWARYGDFVDSLRTREEDFFRGGFVSRLQRKGITGTVLSIQLARGLREFHEDGPRRAGLYVAMSELSISALLLHELLLAGEADSQARHEAMARVVAAMTQVAGEDPRDAGRLGSVALRSLEGPVGDASG